jgi:predicted oxidoreductase
MATRRAFFVKSSAIASLLLVAEIALGNDRRTEDRNTHTRMTSRKIPRTDLTVSRLAFGCAMLGWDWSSPDFAARTVPIIRTAYEQGITFFDLADVYGNGNSEIALGRVLKESAGLRHKLVIQSKCGDRQDGFTIDNSREHILSSVAESLQRLGTDYLDILLLHWPDNLVQPEEVAKAFDQLKLSGKVRYFGVSNHSPTQFELLQKHIHQRLIANQIELGLMYWYLIPQGIKPSLIHTAEGAATLDYCRLHDIWVQAYSPLKAGDIGKTPNVLNPPANALPELRDLAELLSHLSKKYDARPAAIMLAWLLRHPAGITPIIGATSAQHVLDDCVADRIELTREEWYGLLAAAARVRFPAAN